MKRIILIGFMGSGKSTIGKRLAEEFSLPLIEMDAKISDKANMSISDIFSNLGEEKFRELESEVLVDALVSTGIIATGGGVLSRVDNQTLLKKENHVFYLKGSFETLLKNIKNDQVNVRPLATEKDQSILKNLLNSRLKTYEEVADRTFLIDNCSIEEIVNLIKIEIKEME